MKLRNLTLVIFTFLTFATFAQSGKSVQIKSDKSVSELTIETQSFEELSQFNWSSVYNIFESNDPDQKIKLHFGFNQKLELENSDIEKWSITLSGKTSELESMIKRAKSILNKLQEIQKNGS